jgi:hypothetical protein
MRSHLNLAADRKCPQQIRTFFRTLITNPERRSTLSTVDVLTMFYADNSSNARRWRTRRQQDHHARPQGSSDWTDSECDRLPRGEVEHIRYAIDLT